MRWMMPFLLALAVSAGAETTMPLASLNSPKVTFTHEGTGAAATVIQGPGETTDGDGALRVTGVAGTGKGNHYLGVMIPLGKPTDLRDVRLLIDARTALPDTVQAFYVRAYNQGEPKPALSFNSWSGLLGKAWKTFNLQAGMTLDGLAWEPDVVDARVPDRVDRIEVIIGTADAKAPLQVDLDALRTAPKFASLSNLTAPKPLVPRMPLVTAGKPVAVVLHPDTDAGRKAAAAVVATVKACTGATLTARPATAADRQPDQPAIMLGNAGNNPAMLLLYARMLTPVDNVCPGAGGALVHTVHDPFAKGVNVLVLGAGDDAGLTKAVSIFDGLIAKQAKGADLVLPRVFERAYSPEFLKLFTWAGAEPSPKTVAEGLKRGQEALDRGEHTSIAGQLETVARRYELTGNSPEAQLFVKLFDLYGKSAIADPRKYGGPWGFDSDFPSYQVVSGWDVIEEDPTLTDADRLLVARTMARWLTEAVIPKCAGAVGTTKVLFNHQTFPALGALRGGLYYGEGYGAIEGKKWLAMADDIIPRQEAHFKANEDCNGYQWLTNGHVARYCLARPDFRLFTNGNGQKVVDYCVQTMNNLGYQVPYGDTGSWTCWNSEMFVLDAFATATGDPTALWAAEVKRNLKHTHELYSFYNLGAGTRPSRFDGVKVSPLDPAWYGTFPEDPRPPVERCFDKVSFRGAMDPAAEYLLLDGLSLGGHKHLDGNSIEQLTQYERIWLADNDYFKAPTKYHNSMLVFKDGQSTQIPGYAENLGAGETKRYGFSRTRMSGYAGVTWDRAIVWLKDRHAFVVLDRLTAEEPDEYQFRLLWHGMGAPTLNAQGMLLRQQGPSMWFQPAAGPKLRLFNDEELGQGNWSGYKYADPVVRSLSAVAQVKLAKGQSYLYATAVHGAAAGDAQPWQVEYLAGADAVRVQTDAGPVAIGLDSLGDRVTAEGKPAAGAVVVLDGQGVTVLGANTEAAAPQAAQTLAALPTRPPTPNLEIGASAPQHAVAWTVQPQPEQLTLSGNRGVPGTVDLGVKLTSDPQPAAHNVFNESSPNTVAQLLDGARTNSTDTSVMYEPDRVVTLTLDLGQPAELRRLRWFQWWATSSSKKTKYLLKQAVVAVSNDNFAQDSRVVGEVTDPGPHPNFGEPLEYSVDAKGQAARYVRWTITPQPGSAVYLSELLVEGKPPAGAAAVPYSITKVATGRLNGNERDLLVATGEGMLLALKPDGTPLWRVQFPAQLNDVTAADVDGDGRDEVVVGRQDFQLSLLSADGKERWSKALQFYRVPPYVNLVRTGDLDGDGKPEIIAGGNNWRFYAFKADGTELWNYESVHPSVSSAVADLDGDGKCEVICGTHYYETTALKPDGTRLWGYHMGPICYDVATGRFDGDKTRGVVLGGGDGLLHYLGADGKARLAYNTGDEVRHVACADLDGDGKDEVLGASLNDNLYCFGADAKRRWRVDLGSSPSALTTVSTGRGAVVVVGTETGRLLTFDSTGKPLALSELGSRVVDLTADGDTVLVATADGKLRRVKP